jgi:hypothetical protein
MVCNRAGTSRRIGHSYCYVRNVYFDGWSLYGLVGRECLSLLRKATLHVIDNRRFRKIVKSDYVCLSVCSSVRPPIRRHGRTQLLLDEFSRNFIFEYFSKICQENSNSIKI